MQSKLIDVDYTFNSDLGPEYTTITAHLSFLGMELDAILDLPIHEAYTYFSQATIAKAYQVFNEAIVKATEVISTLPPNTTTLDLCGNSLGAKGDWAITALLEAITENVLGVDLSWNEFDQKSTASLVHILSKFRVTINSVSLSWNNLYKKTGYELNEIFRNLNVDIVNLSHNYLGNLPRDHLKLALKGISARVKIIHLEGNGFDKISPDDLEELVSCLPDTVEIAYLDNDVILSQYHIALMKQQKSPFTAELSTDTTMTSTPSNWAPFSREVTVTAMLLFANQTPQFGNMIPHLENSPPLQLGNNSQSFFAGNKLGAPLSEELSTLLEDPLAL